jgi:hypothetical protein
VVDHFAMWFNTVVGYLLNLSFKVECSGENLIGQLVRFSPKHSSLDPPPNYSKADTKKSL